MRGVCRMLAVVIAAGGPCVALAQTIPPSEQPGRERDRFQQPTLPRAQPGGPAVTLPSTVAPPGAAQSKINIRDIRILGATVYDSEELIALSRDLIGRQGSLQDIYDLAQRITAKYGNDGYVLSRAIVPPQQLDPRGSVVHIQVIEGYIDRVEWPSSLTRYRDFFSSYTAKIIADRPTNVRTIERYILLASDLPGLKFSTTLKPSPTNQGAATLVVDVTEKRIDANARVDNRGTAARGPIQFLAAATLNNLFGQHEAFSATWAAATQLRELEYFAGSYRQVLNSEGLTAFVNASYGYGFPGTFQLQSLQYNTRSTIVEAGFSYPLVRLRERNLTLTALGFMSDSHSDILSAPFNEDKLRGFRLKVDADAADPLGAINQFNVTYSQGIDGLGSVRRQAI